MYSSELKNRISEYLSRISAEFPAESFSGRHVDALADDELRETLNRVHGMNWKGIRISDFEASYASVFLIPSPEFCCFFPAALNFILVEHSLACLEGVAIRLARELIVGECFLSSLSTQQVLLTREILDIDLMRQIFGGELEDWVLRKLERIGSRVG